MTESGFKYAYFEIEASGPHAETLEQLPLGMLFSKVRMTTKRAGLHLLSGHLPLWGTPSAEVRSVVASGSLLEDDTWLHAARDVRSACGQSVPTESMLHVVFEADLTSVSTFASSMHMSRAEVQALLSVAAGLDVDPYIFRQDSTSLLEVPPLVELTVEKVHSRAQPDVAWYKRSDPQDLLGKGAWDSLVTEYDRIAQEVKDCPDEIEVHMAISVPTGSLSSPTGLALTPIHLEVLVKLKASLRLDFKGVDITDSAAPWPYPAQLPWFLQDGQEGDTFISKQ